MSSLLQNGVNYIAIYILLYLLTVVLSARVEVYA